MGNSICYTNARLITPSLLVRIGEEYTAEPVLAVKEIPLITFFSPQHRKCHVGVFHVLK